MIHCLGATFESDDVLFQGRSIFFLGVLTVSYFQAPAESRTVIFPPENRTHRADSLRWKCRSAAYAGISTAADMKQLM